MKKIKWNVIMIIFGFLFSLISLIIGYLNHFSGAQGMPILLIGVPLLVVGIVFTPKIRETLSFILDLLSR